MPPAPRSTLWLLEDPENLRGLLQILDPALVERLDFRRAQRLYRTFIPADLQKEESDLVYTVPFGAGRGREVWVYVLREWQDQRRPIRRLRLRPIIPVVYYTGERRWAAPLSLKPMMDVPAEVEATLAAADLPTLAAWLEWAAPAGSLEEVGILG